MIEFGNSYLEVGNQNYSTRVAIMWAQECKSMSLEYYTYVIGVYMLQIIIHVIGVYDTSIYIIGTYILGSMFISLHSWTHIVAPLITQLESHKVQN